MRSGRAAITSPRYRLCSCLSLVGPPITVTPSAFSTCSASGCVVFRLPVETSRAPPSRRVNRRATVLASRWIPVPMVSPRNGSVSLNSAEIDRSSRQCSATQSMRVGATSISDPFLSSGVAGVDGGGDAAGRDVVHVAGHAHLGRKHRRGEQALDVGADGGVRVGDGGSLQGGLGQAGRLGGPVTVAGVG